MWPASGESCWLAIVCCLIALGTTSTSPERSDKWINYPCWIANERKCDADDLDKSSCRTSKHPESDDWAAIDNVRSRRGATRACNNTKFEVLSWLARTDSQAAIDLSRSSPREIGSDGFGEFTPLEIEAEMSPGEIQGIRDKTSATSLFLPATWYIFKFSPAEANFHRLSTCD